MRKFSILLLFLFISIQHIRAVEGMWIPSLINMFYSDMKTYGLKLKPEEIYATNGSSLKDAIVQFNGGCTAEIVSDQGLLLTNHHCGFDAIQRHSSIENDYLKNGFWAKDRDSEIPCPWMRVTFVKEIRPVTKRVMKGIDQNTTESERDRIIEQNIQLIEKRNNKGNIKAKVKAFNQGNEFFMLITEDFNDIRLVGAPPSAIGKYGGDTDNWVWPRHTGDFAVFRIYANADNQSSAYDENNKAFKPKHFLPISMKDKAEGDFTMVYGFPGSTEQHTCSEKLKFYIEKERPSRIKMRQLSLDVMKPRMLADDGIRIKYASKQARIANAWKKWIGQIGGLNELKALDRKKAWEEEYLKKAKYFGDWKPFHEALDALNALHLENEKFEFARAMYIEYFIVGPEFFSIAGELSDILNNYERLKSSGKLETVVNTFKGKLKGFYKNYDLELDKAIYFAQTPFYIASMDPALLPKGFSSSWKTQGEKIYSKSLITDQEKMINALDKLSEKTLSKLSKDPAVLLANAIKKTFFEKAYTDYRSNALKEEQLMQQYVKGILVMFPDRKTWADANSTLRIAYGKVEGSAPVDGMKYLHYTTIDGIMQKYDPDNPDFELTDRFIELYKKKDFGDYTQNDELWVCFTASNHTTGGNSGSPVIDAEGRLMGINFDRSWESTMSDFMFDESRCRNIIVDIRYVLWVIDKYGEAGHLIEEMTLVRD